MGQKREGEMWGGGRNPGAYGTLSWKVTHTHTHSC